MGVASADDRIEKRPAKIRDGDLTHLHYFDKLAPLLERLHHTGCERDRPGNRTLHFDQYCMLILLYLFNPVVKSLRGLQQASELPKVQKRLGCSRASLGSLYESTTVFDPKRLKEIIAELGTQLAPVGRDARLKDIAQTVTLVDGTVLSVLPHLARASFGGNTDGKVRWYLHTHFEVDRHVPRRIDVTSDDGGENDERSVLERTVEPDRLYVMDRGYAKFALFNRIVNAKSCYLCRIRDNSVYEVLESRPVSAEAAAERVTSDSVVSLGSATAQPLGHTVRLITIQAKPHAKCTKAPGPDCDGTIRIATNLLDVPAEVVALLYHYRWTIEIFFRFFKQILGLRMLRRNFGETLPLPEGCKPVLIGQVLKGMKPDDEPVDQPELNPKTKMMVGKNEPMMPIAWKYERDSNPKRRVFTSTIGGAMAGGSDFANEGMRRMFVNACYWCCRLEDKIPEKADVAPAGDNPFKRACGSKTSNLEPLPSMNSVGN